LIEQDQLSTLPLWYAVFLFSITCHEASHALVACRGGDPSAYRGGQVTLNPLPHMKREPMGTVCVPLLSYVMMGFTVGWASAPYDPAWEDRYPRRAAAMALAGPLANLVLVGAGLLLLKLGLDSGVWSVPAEPSFERLVEPTTAIGKTSWDAIGRLCSILAALNFLLFMFNLVPFPPLDGAAVAAGMFEPLRAVRDRLRESGVGGLLGLLVAWLVVKQFYAPWFSWVVVRSLYAT